jgi:hypothetical protein
MPHSRGSQRSIFTFEKANPFFQLKTACFLPLSKTDQLFALMTQLGCPMNCLDLPCQYIRKESVTAVRSQLANYKTFKALTAEWVNLALIIAKEKLLAGRERRTSETQILKNEKRVIRGTRSRDTMK